MGHDSVVPSVKATIKYVNEFKEGKKKDGGDYSLQNIVLTEDGTDLTVVLWDYFRVPESYVGKTVTLTAYDGKAGMGGLWREDREYKGKVYHNLKAKKAKMEIEGVDAKQRRQTALHETEIQAIGLTKGSLMRLANLWLATSQVVDGYVRGASFEMFNNGLKPEQLDKITADLFREAARLNWHEKMPTSSLTAPKHAEPVALPEEEKPVAAKPAADDLDGDDIPF